MFDTITTLTKEAVTEMLEQASDEAVAGCGASDVVYCDRLSSKIDVMLGRLGQSDQTLLLAEAKRYGYATPEERRQADEEMKANGDCSHGLDFMTCPAGCFE